MSSTGCCTRSKTDCAGPSTTFRSGTAFSYTAVRNLSSACTKLCLKRCARTASATEQVASFGADAGFQRADRAPASTLTWGQGAVRTAASTSVSRERVSRERAGSTSLGSSASSGLLSGPRRSAPATLASACRAETLSDGGTLRPRAAAVTSGSSFVEAHTACRAMSDWHAMHSESQMNPGIGSGSNFPCTLRA